MSKITTTDDQNWKSTQLGDFVVSECPLWELVEEDDTMLYVTSAENRAGLYEPVNLPGELKVRAA